MIHQVKLLELQFQYTTCANSGEKNRFRFQFRIDPRTYSEKFGSVLSGTGTYPIKQGTLLFGSNPVPNYSILKYFNENYIPIRVRRKKRGPNRSAEAQERKK